MMDLGLARIVEYPTLAMKSNKDIEYYFTLTNEDLEFINKLKLEKHRLPFALLLKSYEYLHYFPEKLSIISPRIVEYIALQLNQDIKILKSYDNIRSVRSHHINLIRKELGRNTLNENEESINNWLSEITLLTSDFINIIKNYIRKLIAENIELPSLNYIKQIVSKKIDEADTYYYNFIDSSIKLELKEKILNLIKEDQKKISKLEKLKSIPGKATADTVKQQVELLKEYRKFKFEKQIVQSIPIAKRDTYAKLGKEYDISTLRTFTNPKKYTLIVCLLFKNYQDTIDNIIYTYILNL